MQTLPHFISKRNDGSIDMRLDHHMLSTFATCQKLFYWKHVRLLGARGLAPFRLSLGSWISDTLQAFYENLAHGFSRTDFIVTGLELWRKNNLDDYGLIGDRLFERFAEIDKRFDTQVNGQSINGPWGVVLLLQQYYDTYYTQDSRQWQVIATESAFGKAGEILVLEDNVAGYHLRVFALGKPDLVVKDMATGYIFPIDHKSCVDIDDDVPFKYKPGFQFGGYVYATRELLRQQGRGELCDRALINVVARNIPAQPRDRNKRPKPRFFRVPLFYSDEELAEWRCQFALKARRLFESWLVGEWEMSDKQCHFQFGQPCEFRTIDAKPPSARELAAASLYEQKKPWSPYGD